MKRNCAAPMSSKMWELQRIMSKKAGQVFAKCMEGSPSSCC